MSDGSNIDWDFISGKEGGSKTRGYVPDAENSKSGVTIATGFDLGQRNVDDLKGLPDSLVTKLRPYLGKKGKEALEIAKTLEISSREAKLLDRLAKEETLNRLRKDWKEATGTDFDELPAHKATPIASVAFQYGNLEKRTPNFWRQVTNDDWDSAVDNLLDFGDRYRSRRRSEATYFLSGGDYRIEDALMGGGYRPIVPRGSVEPPKKKSGDGKIIEALRKILGG